jgi:hypothetical protein
LTKQLLGTSVIRNKTVVQNLDYTYDPTGNITFVQKNAEQTLFFRNGPVEPHLEYTYDALYKLTEATGREHIGQTKGVATGPGPPEVITTDAPADGVESYIYDASSNMTAMKHQVADAQSPGWTRKSLYTELSVITGEGTKSNRLTSTTVGNSSENYTFDQHGNMISMPHLSQIEWNCFDKIQSLSRQNINEGTPEKTWYVYDANGRRIRKVTERQQQGQNETSSRKLSERITLGNFDIYREYSGAGEVTKQCDTLHITSGGERLALIEHWSGKANKSPSRLIRFQFQTIFTL